MRQFILEKTTLLSYIDFGGEQVFESATVDTSITSFAKAKAMQDSNFKYLLCESQNLIENNFSSIPQSSLSKEGFTFANPATLALKAKIEEMGTPLKEWDINIYRGVLTGLNEAFIITTEQKEQILSSCQSKEEK